MSANIVADSNVGGIRAARVLWDPTAVATITTAEQTVTVPGVRAGDIVLSVNKPTPTVGVGIAGARVSADNTIAVTFVNPTAGSVNPGAEVYTFVWATPEF